jgi:hypothetical protein
MTDSGLTRILFDLFPQPAHLIHCSDVTSNFGTRLQQKMNHGLAVLRYFSHNLFAEEISTLSLVSNQLPHVAIVKGQHRVCHYEQNNSERPDVTLHRII